MTVFCKNLKRLRIAKNFTQEQAAEALGVSTQTVSRWECNTTLPDVTILPKIASLYSPYFMHNDTYEEIVRRLYIIGIYGKEETTPDFIPILEKWFCDTPYHNRVLGIERHLYDQRINDRVLDLEEVKTRITNFLK